jgi:2-methylcitrate dehydratase PrpD
MPAIETFASALAQLRTETIPDAARSKLHLHVVDAMGAWMAASRTPDGMALMAFRRRSGRNDDATSLLLDVATNCALARLSEVDDIHLASMTTPGSIVIPGALTIARSLPADPSDLVAAMAAGYEAMTRLGRVIGGPDILYRGIWPTYFSAPFGMAAVAARLLQLDANRTAHALALALTLAAPGVGHHNAPTTSRWFAIGNAARNGLTAALAAQSGFTSDLGLLDSGLFANVYGIAPDLSALTGGFGTDSMLAQVSFKPWCAARQTMAATEALRQLMSDGVAPDDMTEIRVAVLPPHLKMIDHGVVANDRASHLTSVQYQMALAAHRPDVVYDLRQTPSELAPELRSFMARIRVEADDALLASYPSAWPARLSVATMSGTYERSVVHVPGDPDRPFDWPRITDKFRNVVAPVLAREQADGMTRRIVESLGDRQSLMRLVDEVNQICRHALAGS